MALPSRVPTKISKITTGVKPIFENATPTTPTKTRAMTATNRNTRIAKTSTL